MTTLGLRSTLLSAVPGISHGFFGRTGGTSPHPWRGLNGSFAVGDAPARVEENLARIRFQIGVARRRLLTATQVHGPALLVVDEASDTEAIGLQEADALLTGASGLAVGVRTADCAPVLLATRDGAAVAAVHAGWRGAVGGVIQAAIAGFAEVGAKPADLVAAVGPCIGLRAFEVGPEVVAAAAEAVSLEGLVKEGKGDRRHLHLEGLCLRVLATAGVEAEGLALCTFDDLDEEGEPLWFSHRRDEGKTGRQLSVIARAEPPKLDAATFG